jgi:hypothetical protein
MNALETPAAVSTLVTDIVNVSTPIAIILYSSNKCADIKHTHYNCAFDRLLLATIAIYP